MNIILKRVAGVACILLLTGVVGNGVLFALGMWNFNNMTGLHEVADTYVAQSTETKSIDIKINAGDVQILPADVDTPTVRTWVWTEDTQLRQDIVKEYLQGETLQLIIDDNWRRDWRHLLFPVKHKSSRVQVLLPRKEYETMAIYATSGIMSGETLTAGVLTVTVESGRFKLKDCQAGEIIANAHSGKLEMVNCRADKINSRVLSGSSRFVNITGKLDIANSSGRMKVSLAEITDDVMIQISSGSADIIIGHASTPFRLDATAVSGSMDIDLPQAGHQIHSTSSFQGNVGQGQNGPQVKVAVMSGRVKIY